MARRFFGMIGPNGPVCWDSEYNQPVPQPTTLCDVYASRTVKDEVYLTLHPYRKGGKSVKQITGVGLSNITRTIGKKMGVRSDVINKVIALQPSRMGMVAYLRMNKIPVTNINDMFELTTKYVKANPKMRGYLNDNDYKSVLGLRKTASIDGGAIGDIIGGVIDIIGQLSDNTPQEIAAHISAHQQYMRDDMAAITATLNATQGSPGPWGGWGIAGAYDMLARFEKTSWAELKSFIETRMGQIGQPVPAAITNLWNEQSRLKEELRFQYCNEGDTQRGRPNTSDSSNTNWAMLCQGGGGTWNGGGGGSGTGRLPTGGGDISAMIQNNLIPILLVVVAIFVLPKLFKR